MNAIELLRTQHDEVRSLFERIDDDSDLRARLDEIGRIADRLKMHTKLEEEIFYPAVESLGGKAAELVREGRREHDGADRMLEELGAEDLTPDDTTSKRVQTCLHDLRKCVEHHAAEEEREMFPLAEKLGRERLAELAREMEIRIRAGVVSAVDAGADQRGTAAHH
jgi:iron-sulfur cluster repair protein YtfE (RIC family)